MTTMLTIGKADRQTDHLHPDRARLASLRVI
jgi:hypothetical protein